MSQLTSVRELEGEEAKGIIFFICSCFLWMYEITWKKEKRRESISCPTREKRISNKK